MMVWARRSASFTTTPDGKVHFPFHVRPHQRTPGRSALERNARRCRASRPTRCSTLRRLADISSTGRRLRNRLCIAFAVLAVPTSTCTSTAWAAAGHRRVTHRHMRSGILVWQSITFGTFSPRLCRSANASIVGAWSYRSCRIDARCRARSDLDEVIGRGVLGRVADLAGGGGLRHGD